MVVSSAEVNGCLELYHSAHFWSCSPATPIGQLRALEIETRSTRRTRRRVKWFRSTPYRNCLSLVQHHNSIEHIGTLHSPCRRPTQEADRHRGELSCHRKHLAAQTMDLRISFEQRHRKPPGTHHKGTIPRRTHRSILRSHHRCSFSRHPQMDPLRDRCSMGPATQMASTSALLFALHLSLPSMMLRLLDLVE